MSGRAMLLRVVKKVSRLSPGNMAYNKNVIIHTSITYCITLSCLNFNSCRQPVRPKSLPSYCKIRRHKGSLLHLRKQQPFAASKRVAAAPIRSCVAHSFGQTPDEHFGAS